ncbi:MAG: hypothetical protein WCF93_02150 [Candidatus Moraniibacteriota bacterium]
MNKALYRVSGWSRRVDISMGACVFSVELDASFAEKTRELKLSYEQQSKFEQYIREIIEYEHARVSFWNDTAFLRSMAVQGNCACLGVEGMILERDWGGFDFITYNGHNVDSKIQAYDLLTVFSSWVETVEALLY